MLELALQPPAEVRALLFDCDGTLVDTLGAFRRAWTAPFAELGFTVTDEWFAEHAGLSATPFIEAALPGLAPDARAGAEAAAFRSFLGQAHLLVTFDRVVDVARAFHGRLPLAVVSGGRRETVEATLAAVGIRDLFGLVVTVDDVEQGKPAPDVYLYALDRLGLQGRECLAYEDTDSGIAAASAAGLAVIDVRLSGEGGPATAETCTD